MSKKNKKKLVLNKKEKYQRYFLSLEYEDQEKLKKFFKDLNNRLYVLSKDKKLIRTDFERAFIEYDLMGISLDRALELLDLSNLGGFYSRDPNFWLPLDEVGKSYTQFLDRNNMAVFREAFYLKERIHPEILQMALNFTIKRFPYFAMSVKRGLFWHYLDSIRRRFPVEKEGPIPVQRIPIALSGSKTFRVLFYENRISVEFFHCMTDGTGGKEFLKSLTATYLKLMDKDIKPSELVIDANSIVDNDEYKNEFLNVKRINNPKGYLNKKALQLSGPLAVRKPCRIIHFRMDVNKLKEVAKKYEVGLTPYLLTALTFACKAAMDELKGDISITVPVNMRKCFPSKTLRNFSLFTSIRTPIDQMSDFGEICRITQKNLKDQTNKDIMLEMAGSTANIMNNIRYIPLPLKIFGLKALYSLFADNIFTISFSNLGVCDLPSDMAKEITGMDFVLGTTVKNRAQTSAITVNGVTCLTIAKYTKDPSFEEKLYDILTNDGLSLTVEGSEYCGN